MFVFWRLPLTKYSTKNTRASPNRWAGWPRPAPSLAILVGTIAGEQDNPAMQFGIQGSWYIQGAFFNCSAQISVLKRKTLFNQRGSFVHREFHGTESLIGCPSFFILVLKIGRNTWKPPTLIPLWISEYWVRLTLYSTHYPVWDFGSWEEV